MKRMPLSTTFSGHFAEAELSTNRSNFRMVTIFCRRSSGRARPKVRSRARTRYCSSKSSTTTPTSSSAMASFGSKGGPSGNSGPPKFSKCFVYGSKNQDAVHVLNGVIMVLHPFLQRREQFLCWEIHPSCWVSGWWVRSWKPWRWRVCCNGSCRTSWFCCHRY